MSLIMQSAGSRLFKVKYAIRQLTVQSQQCSRLDFNNKDNNTFNGDNVFSWPLLINQTINSLFSVSNRVSRVFCVKMKDS